MSLLPSRVVAHYKEPCYKPSMNGFDRPPNVEFSDGCLHENLPFRPSLRASEDDDSELSINHKVLFPSHSHSASLLGLERDSMMRHAS